MAHYSSAPLLLLVLLLMGSQLQQGAKQSAQGGARGIISCAAFTPEAIAPLAQLASSRAGAASSGLIGSYVDLSALGGPAYGMSSSLFSMLQQVLVNVFSADANNLASLLSGGTGNLASLATGGAGGFAAGFSTGLALGATTTTALPALPPPLLPALPKAHALAPFAASHDILLRVLADKWAAALVKMQYNPGLQGFLRLLGLDQLQEALLKWVCILFPWADAIMPAPIRDLKNAYCIKALPAAAVSKILAGPPRGGLPLPLPGTGGAAAPLLGGRPGGLAAFGH